MAAPVVVAKFVASSFLTKEIPTKPHWSLYVCAAAATVAAISAVVAFNLTLLAYGGVFAALSGTFILTGFYLYRFSRDHAIVVAGRAQKEALKDIQETIKEEKKTLDQIGELVQQLKDEQFAKEYAEEAEAMKKVAASLVETINKYREMQQRSLEKTKKYTDQVVSELKAHNLALTVTNKNGQNILEQVARLEEARKTTVLQLEELIAERKEGRDLLQGVQEELQAEIKRMRKMAHANNLLVEGLLKEVERIKVAEAAQNASLRQIASPLGRVEKQGNDVEAQLKRILQAKAEREKLSKPGGDQ